MLDIHNKLFSDFVILEDSEEVSGIDLFVAFLKYFSQKDSAEEIHFICIENAPEFYFQLHKPGKNSKLIIQNFFSDSHLWNDTSVDVVSALSQNEKFSNKILFIDSLSQLVIHFGFNAVYKLLFNLNLKTKKMFCLSHGDLFTSNQIHELTSLSTTYVKVQRGLTNLSAKEASKKNKIIGVMCKPNNSKPHIYNLIISLDGNLNFSISQDCGDLIIKEAGKIKKDLKTLTTFKLGISLSKNEEKARNELILPFLRNTHQSDKDNKPSIDEYEDGLEDDPDDDLDF